MLNNRAQREYANLVADVRAQWQIDLDTDHRPAVDILRPSPTTPFTMDVMRQFSTYSHRFPDLRDAVLLELQRRMQWRQAHPSKGSRTTQQVYPKDFSHILPHLNALASAQPVLPPPQPSLPIASTASTQTPAVSIRATSSTDVAGGSGLADITSRIDPALHTTSAETARREAALPANSTGIGSRIDPPPLSSSSDTARREAALPADSTGIGSRIDPPPLSSSADVARSGPAEVQQIRDVPSQARLPESCSSNAVSAFESSFRAECAPALLHCSDQDRQRLEMQLEVIMSTTKHLTDALKTAINAATVVPSIASRQQHRSPSPELPEHSQDPISEAQPEDATSKAGINPFSVEKNPAAEYEKPTSIGSSSSRSDTTSAPEDTDVVAAGAASSTPADRPHLEADESATSFLSPSKTTAECAPPQPSTKFYKGNPSFPIVKRNRVHNELLGTPVAAGNDSNPFRAASKPKASGTTAEQPLPGGTSANTQTFESQRPQSRRPDLTRIMFEVTSDRERYKAQGRSNYDQPLMQAELDKEIPIAYGKEGAGAGFGSDWIMGEPLEFE
ncbi:hypothetical protein MMC16_007682 [Acarospora aff. strigata]|nr:hypothetical protein [Acarospora aff. strigata]